MAKATKAILITSLVVLMISYLVASVYIYESMDRKIERLQTALVTAGTRREYLISQKASLQQMKASLASEIAIEAELSKKRELALELSLLADEEREKQMLELSAAQAAQSAAEKARAQEQRDAQLLELQKRQEALLKAQSESKKKTSAS